MPINQKDFGLATNRITQFDASVSGSATKKDLEDPKTWVNVAQFLTMGSEIRCLAEDMSFVMYGICTFVLGSKVKIKIIEEHKLDKVEKETVSGDFTAKLRGPHKWCILNSETGDEVQSGIATEADALKEIAQLTRALAS